MNSKTKLFKDQFSGQFTTTLHEIFFGRGKRELSVKYNLQVPLDTINHLHAHGRNVTTSTSVLRGKSQEWCARKFCKLLCIDYDKTNLAINTLDYDYLKYIKEHCYKKLIAMEY